MTLVLDFGRKTTRCFSTRPAIIRVRFAGELMALPMSALDIGITSSDAQIRAAVATTLRIPLDRLDEHTVDRHLDGTITVRPDATFV